MTYQQNYSGSEDRYKIGSGFNAGYSSSRGAYSGGCPLCGNSPGDSHLGKYGAEAKASGEGIPTLSGAYLD